VAGPPASRPTRPPAGVLLAARHFPCSAEIYLMAVDPAMRRCGAGRALVAALETDLITEGVRFLQVKTLGPARPDAGYEQTRKFYASVGFWPLEETRDLWPENPCLIMIKALR
jgi:GNAT superfamily N-acetyltransferase